MRRLHSEKVSTGIILTLLLVYFFFSFNVQPARWQAAPLTIENAYLVVRGMDNRIYYRTDSASPNSWAQLPSGFTCDGPASVLAGNKLHVVVRSIDGSSIWHCYVNINDGSFSGWTLLSGLTPSAPTLTTNGTHLCLVVRGLDDRIYYSFHNLASRIWSGWTALPWGSTCDSPAAAILNGELHVVIRSTDGLSIWHSYVDLSTGAFSGWTLNDGLTQSSPTLTECSSRNEVILVVRGLDNAIYRDAWSGLGWTGWVRLPNGFTCDGPEATVIGEELHVVVQGIEGLSIWEGSVDLATGSFSGWTPLSGLTPSKPTLLPESAANITKIISLKQPTAQWAQVFAMTQNNGKIYFSLTQGYEAGYAGEGGIYSIDPATLKVKTEFYYSAQGAWWANYPTYSAIGGSWGVLSDGDNVYFGGYAINDINGDFINLKDNSVNYLPNYTYEIWSLAKIGQTVYAGTSFNIYTTTDLHTWTKLPGTDRRVDIDENVIWGMAVYSNTLYCVSNFLYRYDTSQQKLVELSYFEDMNTLKPICVWNNKIWFSGYGASVNQNYTWLVSYNPETTQIEKYKVDANSIVDIIAYEGSLWLAGYTGPRLMGEYLRGDKGLLFKFDGQTLQKVVELDSSEGLVGLAGYGDYIYFGTFTGDVYRMPVP